MLTSAQNKLLDFAVQVRDGEYEPEKAFISREMVQATLPHRNPGDVPAWSRVNGNYALVVQPGWDSWKNQSFGYPYGTIPRLLIFWLIAGWVRCSFLPVMLKLPHSAASTNTNRSSIFNISYSCVCLSIHEKLLIRN